MALLLPVQLASQLAPYPREVRIKAKVLPETAQPI